MNRIVLAAAVVLAAACANPAQGYWSALQARAASACNGIPACGITASTIHSQIPANVRAKGPAEVLAWIKARDISHIQPKKTHPHLAGRADNVIWERSSWNRARGARPMTGSEWWRAQMHNRLDAIRAFGGCFTLTLPLVAVPEIAVQLIHTTRGHQDISDALVQAATNTGWQTAAGTLVCGVIRLAGITAMAPSLTVPLLAIGAATYVAHVAHRVWDAADPESLVEFKAAIFELVSNAWDAVLAEVRGWVCRWDGDCADPDALAEKLSGAMAGVYEEVPSVSISELNAMPLDDLATALDAVAAGKLEVYENGFSEAAKEIEK